MLVNDVNIAEHALANIYPEHRGHRLMPWLGFEYGPEGFEVRCDCGLWLYFRNQAIEAHWQTMKAEQQLATKRSDDDDVAIQVKVDKEKSVDGALVAEVTLTPQTMRGSFVLNPSLFEEKLRVFTDALKASGNKTVVLKGSLKSSGDVPGGPVIMTSDKAVEDAAMELGLAVLSLTDTELKKS